MTKAEILKAIREKCLDCCCGQANEVKECVSAKCPLHSLRFGKDPTKRVLSPEEKARRAELMRTVVENRRKQQESEDEP